MQESSGFYERKLILSVLHTREELTEKFRKEFPYTEISNKVVGNIEKRLGNSFFNMSMAGKVHETDRF